MSKYDTLDAAILKAIRRGKTKFFDIDADLSVHALSNRIGDATGVVGWRIVDRRLQALRKAGRIVYAKGAWSVVEPEEQAQEAAR